MRKHLLLIALFLIILAPVAWAEKYYVAYSAADQGVSSRGSLKYLIDSIGSKSATIVFPHTLATTQTTTGYTFSTNETCPANITIEVEHGAVLTFPTGGIKLTQNGPFKADAAKCLTVVNSTTGITFGSNSIREAYAEWWNDDASADRTLALQSAIRAFKVLRLGIATYKHSGLTLYSDNAILGMGQDNSTLEYLLGTGDAITLAGTTGFHRRSRIKDLEMSSDALRTSGWAINTVTGEEQADIELSHITIQGYDNGIWIKYPSQGNLDYVRCDLNGKAKSGSIGIQIGSAPNTALDITMIAPYVNAVETCYVIYGYVQTLIKPIWETCTTGLKVYGYTSVYSPYQHSDTTDIYVYNNGGYGNLTLLGSIAETGTGPVITYETDAVKNRTTIIPMSFSSSNPARIGPYEFGLDTVTTFTKVRVSRNAAFTLTDDTWTNLSFDTELIDELAEHATTTGVTISKDGYYLVQVQVKLSQPSDGARIGIAVYKNTAELVSSEQTVGASGAYPTSTCTYYGAFEEGDLVQGYARSKGGGATVGIVQGNTATYMFIARLF